MKITPKVMEMAGPQGQDLDKAFGDGTSATAVTIEGDTLILNLAELQ